MSGFIRLSSSSGTVRLAMYQKIQKMRLRKIRRGPDSTKKSQKLKGAKMPMRRRRRPTMSSIRASARKKLPYLPCSMVKLDRAGHLEQVDVFGKSDASDFPSSSSFFFHS